MCFESIYENKRMKSVEIVVKRKGEKENIEGSKSKIYFKHTFKYHNVSPCTIIVC
jgi:hypothetical protein